MIKLLHIVFVYIFFINLSFSQIQTYNFIEGKIYDLKSNKPIENALVQLEFGLDIYRTQTDENGKYSIKTTVRYIDGKYKISIKQENYYELNGIVLIKDNVVRDFGLKQRFKPETTIDTTTTVITLDGFADNNWTLLIDVSSSMKEQLPIIKSGLDHIINYFRAEDKITILAFSTQVKTILSPTTGNNKQQIVSAINSIKIGGQTEGAAAIEKAFSNASQNYIEKGNNRIMILTDGMFTSGNKEYSKIEKIIKFYSDKKINCSIFLFGQPTPYVIQNLEQLALAGKGTFAVINDEATAKTKLLEEAKLVMKE